MRTVLSDGMSAKVTGNDGAEPDKSRVIDVVVIVHGIRDYAVWETDVANALTTDTIKTVSIKYGRFDLLQFLFLFVPPIIAALTHDLTPLVRVTREIRNVRDAYPGARISVIAHSFGTYLIRRYLAF